MEAVRPMIRMSVLCARRQSMRSRYLHSSIAYGATPVPLPSRPGPPPPPPEPPVSEPNERVSRKRRQAELFLENRNKKTDPSKPTSVLKRRFWKDVSVKDTPEGLQVYLDSRAVRTATKDVLNLPRSKQHLATAVALEWDQLVSAQQALKQHYIPLTSLVSRAIDIAEADRTGDQSIRQSIVDFLFRYLSTDTLLCWVPHAAAFEIEKDERGNPKTTLREVQEQTANQIISHLTTFVWPNVEILPVLGDSILPATQPQPTQDIVRGWITGLGPFELAGLERAVLATKSLLCAVRLIVEWSQEFRDTKVLGSQQGLSRFTIEDAVIASRLEVGWQTSRWGEVDDTHDVEKEDMRRQLGSVVLLVSGQDH